MTRLAILLLGVMLVGCDNPVAPDGRSVDNVIQDATGMCVKYKIWPDSVDIVADQFATCQDGMAPEVVAAQWESATPGMCPVTPDGSGIRGGLKAVRYLYGCRKWRAPAVVNGCADCDWGEK